MPASITAALDQHAGAVRRGGAVDASGFETVELLPAMRTLFMEATAAGIVVRLLPVALEADSALLAWQELLPEADAIPELKVADGPGPHILVAADRVLRQQGRDMGYRPVAHPSLALPTLRGEMFAFASVTGDRASLRSLPGLLPYWLERRSNGLWRAFGVLSEAGLAAAVDDGLELERLALDAERQDPLLVHLDEGADAGRALARYELLWSDGARALLALDASTRNDEVPAHGAHGHFVFLTPSPELFDEPSTSPAPARFTVASPAVEAQAADAAAPVTAASFVADVGRYAGATPLDGAGPIQSRHSSHPDNARVVAALIADLTAIGYTPYTHGFSFGGRTLYNVIADLPGSHPGIVIVGCHLDSTAARDAGYDPTAHPARGADDDASGIAATLAIARHMRSLSDPLGHAVRFCFFNAEESGLVGSRAYAASLKAVGELIRAVVCCDMIGFNSDLQRIFEVHAGYTDPAVRDISVPIAELVATMAATLGALGPAQVYKGTTAVGGTDRTVYDGAINRSDHAAFHQQGYPAVVVTEDFFPNDPGEPGSDANPNYHRDADATIDAAYGADITRAVSLAVVALASADTTAHPVTPITDLLLAPVTVRPPDDGLLL